MVRKRSRKYESEDNDSDSDADFAPEEVLEPAPKKYSLRERKAPNLLTTDFDYYGLDEDDDAQKQSSDDEDFEVETEVDALIHNAPGDCDPESPDPQNAEGLIDFEDIIRADIVVNRNKIDYDNLIQKTEIKLTPPPKRRGRKPKYQVINETTPQLNDNRETQPPNINGETKPELGSEKAVTIEADVLDGQATINPLQPEVKLSEFSDEIAANQVNIAKQDDTNGTNNLDHLSESLSKEHDAVTPNSQEIVPKAAPDISAETTSHKDDDDDVIVLGELQQEVIVLDD